MNARDVRNYEVRVVGHLDDRWASCFADLTLACYADGTCTLTGEVADQAQLHGILARLRDLGSTLISVRLLDDDHLLSTSMELILAESTRFLGLCQTGRVTGC